jgi:hypothetical protein
MKSIVAIKTYFQKDGGREVTTAELMELRKAGQDGYNEVARLCANELGETLD